MVYVPIGNGRHLCNTNEALVTRSQRLLCTFALVENINSLGQMQGNNVTDEERKPFVTNLGKCISHNDSKCLQVPQAIDKEASDIVKRKGVLKHRRALSTQGSAPDEPVANAAASKGSAPPAKKRRK